MGLNLDMVLIGRKKLYKLPLWNGYEFVVFVKIKPVSRIYY